MIKYYAVLTLLFALALVGCTTQSKPGTKSENKAASKSPEAELYQRINDPEKGDYLVCDAPEIEFDSCEPTITVPVENVRDALKTIIDGIDYHKELRAGRIDKSDRTGEHKDYGTRSVNKLAELWSELANCSLHPDMLRKYANADDPAYAMQGSRRPKNDPFRGGGDRCSGPEAECWIFRCAYLLLKHFGDDFLLL